MNENIRGSVSEEYRDYDFYGALAKKLGMDRLVVQTAVLECSFGIQPVVHGLRRRQLAAMIEAFNKE